MRVTVLQPVLPRYRIPFFDAVAASPDIDLSVVTASKDHAAEPVAHVSGLPYVDDCHEWLSLARAKALLWQLGLEDPARLASMSRAATPIAANHSLELRARKILELGLRLSEGGV